MIVSISRVPRQDSPVHKHTHDHTYSKQLFLNTLCRTFLISFFIALAPEKSRLAEDPNEMERVSTRYGTSLDQPRSQERRVPRLAILLFK